MKEEQNYNETIDHLIQVYLKGGCTPDELKDLHSWVQANSNNRRYFQESCKIWNSASEINSSFTFNSDNAITKFHEFVNNSEKAKVKKNTKLNVRRLSLTLSVAATILILLGLTTLLSSKKQMMGLVAQHTILRDTLPDGTQVTLNKNSSLTYSRNSITKSRHVVMHGEIFFHVAKEHGIPFTVNFSNFGVRVVGTSFNIKMSTNKAVVSVFEGVVKVYTRKGLLKRKTDEVILNKDERVVLSQSKQNNLKIKKTDQNSLAWERGEFIFESTSLEKVVKDLTNYYGVKISIADDSLKHLKLNAKLGTGDLKLIFKVLSLTFDVKIDKQEKNSYLIRKKV